MTSSPVNTLQADGTSPAFISSVALGSRMIEMSSNQASAVASSS
jgi:hypothetical protein